MSRIRTIKPAFWTSEQVANLSRDARLLFIGMWNFCDDNGIHPAKVRTLRLEIFPGDDLTDGDVSRLVQEMIEQELVIRYSVVGHGDFWQVTGWHHQRIDQPTYIFPLPGGSLPEGQARRRQKIIDRKDSELFDERSANTPRTFVERSPREGKGQGQEEEKEGKPSPSALSRADGDPPPGLLDPGPFPVASPRPVADVSLQRNPELITYRTFIAGCEARGEDTMPADDPVFRWADEARVPLEFLRLAWLEFRNRYIDSGKRYRDWRRVYRNACRDNRFKLWFCDHDGKVELTSQGRLLLQSHGGMGGLYAA